MASVKRKLLVVVIFLSLITGLTALTWRQAHVSKEMIDSLSTSQEIDTHQKNDVVHEEVIQVITPKTPSESDQVVDLIAGNLMSQEMPSNLKDADWDSFTQTVKANWNIYNTSIGKPMLEWSAHEIPGGQKKVFYPFSGPDFTTLFQLYPHANHFVMTAQQRGERLVNLSTLNPTAAKQTIEVLSSAWKSFGHDGFFVTEYLFKYISQNKVKIGSTTLIASFAHLHGFSIQKIVPIEIDEQGILRELGDEQPWDSVRFYMVKDNKSVILDYVRMDLSNAGFKKSPQHLTFFVDAAKSPILLKAASHLPQHKDFTLVRDALLNNSPYIIQDETGLDYHPLSSTFNTVLYGSFVKAYKVFSTYNIELAKAYKDREDEKPLPFRVGYFKDGNYALITATKKTSQ